MSPNARRRGLRAAAAVAAIALTGCGPRKAAPDPAPTETSTETPSAADVKSCDAQIASHEMPLAESDRACCETLAAHHSANMDTMMGWETRSACCELLDWQGSKACTPWGPPTPPAMA